MRSTIYSAMNTATAYAILDGVAIPNFQNKFRVQSPAFSLTLPNSKFWTAIYGVPFESGTALSGCGRRMVWPAASPLSPGHHVLRFGGNVGSIWLFYQRNVFS